MAIHKPKKGHNGIWWTNDHHRYVAVERIRKKQVCVMLKIKEMLMK